MNDWEREREREGEGEKERERLILLSSIVEGHGQTEQQEEQNTEKRLLTDK